jgi:hypothetical protein
MPFFLGFGAQGVAALRLRTRCGSTRSADARLNLWLDWQLRKLCARVAARWRGALRQ